MDATGTNPELDLDLDDYEDVGTEGLDPMCGVSNSSYNGCSSGESCR
ncbi:MULTISPECIES: hypothetical protein [unclassified Streptomyces]